MHGIKRRSLERALSMFVALVTISFIAVVAWNSWSGRIAKLKESEVDAANMTRALAQHAQDTIEGIDNVLAGVVERLEQAPLDAAETNRMHRYLRQRVSERPQLHGIFVHDEHGGWQVNSQEILRTDVNIADREYFMFHRDFADRGPHIGAPVRSRTTDEWILTVSRRVNHPDGRFAGVVVATVKMAYFRSFYDRFDIGENGSILLASDSGMLLVRRPFNESAIGADIVKGPVFQHYATYGSPGTAMLVSKMDGIERLYSYRHLDDFPLLVATGRSKRELLADWRNETSRIVLGSGCLVAMLWLLGLRLRIQIGVREQARSELRHAKEELEAINSELAVLALQDGLTGVGNRRRFDAALDVEYGRARRNGVPLALVLIDVDYFKKYNDAYGHPQGDECLRQVARALKAIPGRPADLVARYGGEEFVVLLPATDLAGATVIGERIRAAIERLGIAHSGNAGGVVTVSAGVAASVPERGDGTPQMLLRAADQALYEAKGAGRNQVHAFLEGG